MSTNAPCQMRHRPLINTLLVSCARRHRSEAGWWLDCCFGCQWWYLDSRNNSQKYHHQVKTVSNKNFINWQSQWRWNMHLNLHAKQKSCLELLQATSTFNRVKMPHHLKPSPLLKKFAAPQLLQRVQLAACSPPKNTLDSASPWGNTSAIPSIL